MELDPHGQPPSAVNAPRRTVRDICEMFGVVKGLIADGALNEKEAVALADWVNAHKDVMRTGPGRVLADRLQRIFADGRVEEMERRDLYDLLEDLAGGVAGIIDEMTASSAIPLDDPPPTLEVTDRVFCFSGRFAHGTRTEVEQAVTRLGGWCEPQVTLATDFLVIGTFASRDWRTSPMGAKIFKAMEYRDKHGRPRIIGENYWSAHV